VSRVTISLILFFVSMFVAYPAQAADGTVGSATAASCTEAAFNTALANVQTSGSGTLTFNCGGTATINFTAGKVISAADVTIDGGSQITLSGVNTVRHFYIDSNANLTLKNITLTNGFDDTYGGGSILSLGGLTLDNTTIRDSNVDPGYSGGAIMAYKPVTITNSLIENNSGGSVGGLFLFGEAADATITGSTFRSNRTTNAAYGLGGALTTWNGADVTIRSSTLEQNQARYGGAIYNESAYTTVLIEQDSILDNNSVTIYGGGIYNDTGTVTLSQATLSNNKAESYGGGLYNIRGNVSITNTTISNNSSKWGGGIFNERGTVTLTQVTLSGNKAISSGGAILNYIGDLNLDQVTISGNSADSGGGIYSEDGNLDLTYVTFGGNIAYSAVGGIYLTGVSRGTVKNVIIDGTGTSAVNCYEYYGSGTAITSLGFNLSSDASCPFNQAGDQNNIDPMLGPLADNGGPTLTHMLLSGSPAIDAGQCVTGLTTDQRGLPRLQGPACDIGAVERQPDDTDRFTIYLPLISQ
jgi:predicted outer membrane repeat protein